MRMNKIVATAACMSMLALWIVVPSAAGQTYTKYDSDDITKMLGVIDNADISNFVEPFPEKHKQLMKQDWLDFKQAVNDAIKKGNGDVDNSHICIQIWVHVWSWEHLYQDLQHVAKC